MPRSPVSSNVKTRDLAAVHHLSPLAHAFMRVFPENTAIKVTGRVTGSYPDTKSRFSCSVHLALPRSPLLLVKLAI